MLIASTLDKHLYGIPETQRVATTHSIDPTLTWVFIAVGACFCIALLAFTYSKLKPRQ